MKSLLKFTLLAALIISGKLVKEAAPVAVAKTVEPNVAPTTSLMFVNQTRIVQPVKPVREQAQPQHSGSGLLAEMF